MSTRAPRRHDAGAARALASAERFRSRPAPRLGDLHPGRRGLAPGTDPSLTVDVEASVLTAEPVEDSELAVDEDPSRRPLGPGSGERRSGAPQVSATTTADAVIATDRIDVDFSTHWQAASDGSVGVLYLSNHTFAAVLTIPADGELRIAWQGKVVASTPIGLARPLQRAIERALSPRFRPGPACARWP